jgi:hypothetical protein
VTVSVTVLAPTLEQSNVSASIDNVTSQLSNEPLSTSDAPIETKPFSSSDTEIS